MWERKAGLCWRLLPARRSPSLSVRFLPRWVPIPFGRGLLKTAFLGSRLKYWHKGDQSGTSKSRSQVWFSSC